MESTMALSLRISGVNDAVCAGLKATRWRIQPPVRVERLRTHRLKTMSVKVRRIP